MLTMLERTRLLIIDDWSPEPLAADPRCRLTALTMLTVARMLRHRPLAHAAQLDVGPTLQPPRARDLVALLRHHALQLSNLAEQPDHQRFNIRTRKLREIAGWVHVQTESCPVASAQARNRAPPGFLPGYAIYHRAGSARRLVGAVGFETAKHKQYLKAPIETSIVTNAAVTAYTELRALNPHELRIVCGVYLLTHEVGTPPWKMVGLAEPPTDPDAFAELATANTRSERFRSLFTSA